MDLGLIVKGKDKKYYSWGVYADGGRLERCCGILEYGEASIYKYKFPDERSWGQEPATPAEKKRAVSETAAKKLIVAAMATDFSSWAQIVMTDYVGGNNEKLMKMFNDKRWSKKLIYAQKPSHSTGRMLVTCVLTRKPDQRKAKKA